jgi:hypothetical protein
LHALYSLPGIAQQTGCWRSAPPAARAPYTFHTLHHMHFIHYIRHMHYMHYIMLTPAAAGRRRATGCWRPSPPAARAPAAAPPRTPGGSPSPPAASTARRCLHGCSYCYIDVIIIIITLITIFEPPADAVYNVYDFVVL